MIRPESRDTYLVFGQPQIGQAEIDEVVDTLRSNWIGTGPKVERFQQDFAQAVGAERAVALGSCTAGLHLALIAGGVGPGDEVITTPMTFVASVNAIHHVGATPVLVDIDPVTQNIDPEAIAAAITPATRALLPVHMAGRPCDMDAIQALADNHDLLVIEDAAHAIGASYRGRPIGSMSDFTAFSFYATKNITTAEGGMVTVSDPHHAEMLEVLSLHGLTRGAWQRYSDAPAKHYAAVVPGFKYNMTDLQASLGLHQLPRVGEWQQRREEIWARYDQAFADLPVELPAPVEDGSVHARHLYTALLDLDEVPWSRDQVRGHLHELGIGSGIHFVAVHLHPYFAEALDHPEGSLPIAEDVSRRTLSLPLTPFLTDRDVDDVIAGFRWALTA